MHYCKYMCFWINHLSIYLSINQLYFFFIIIIYYYYFYYSVVRLKKMSFGSGSRGGPKVMRWRNFFFSVRSYQISLNHVRRGISADKKKVTHPGTRTKRIIFSLIVNINNTYIHLTAFIIVKFSHKQYRGLLYMFFLQSLSITLRVSGIHCYCHRIPWLELLYWKIWNCISILINRILIIITSCILYFFD